jgi:threonine synthase
MTEFRCTVCQTPYPEEGAPYRCPKCLGVYDLSPLPLFDPAQIDPGQPGIWRYRQTFGLSDGLAPISLGEGNTPLEWREVGGRRLAFKLEYANPTGSFKDRGSAPLLAFLRGRGIQSAVEDSSGNAGASYAAYAAEAGLQAKVFVPDYASGPKREQIERFGAQIVRILGVRSKTTEAALRAVESGEVYASHAWMPHGLAGYATLAYELYDQLDGAPGSIIVPAGMGNLLLSIGRGFESLKRAGLIDHLPVLVGVQALACAPLWAVYRYGAAGHGWVSEGETLAEGVRVKHPVRGDAVLQTLASSQGYFFAVEENTILPGRDALKALGFSVEPTSAIVWDALQQTGQHLPDPIVVVLTGAGWKSMV